MRAAFAAHVLRAVRGARRAAVSDYGSGLVTPALVRRRRSARCVGAAARAAARSSSTPATRCSKFRGMTACTPNESEVEQLLGVRIGENARVARAGRARSCCERTRAAGVLITRGSRGMALFEPDRPTVHIPIVGSDQIADVTGAGDTVIATMTLALSAGAHVRSKRRTWPITPAASS